MFGACLKDFEQRQYGIGEEFADRGRMSLVLLQRIVVALGTTMPHGSNKTFQLSMRRSTPFFLMLLNAILVTKGLCTDQLLASCLLRQVATTLELVGWGDMAAFRNTTL